MSDHPPDSRLQVLLDEGASLARLESLLAECEALLRTVRAAIQTNRDAYDALVADRKHPDPGE